MTRLPMYRVDAFTDRLFGGNPAAVVLLKEWLPDATMQAIAAENNLPATAFLQSGPAGYSLRWFTPSLELPLCGHGTLASAHMVLRHLEPSRGEIVFATPAGPLAVTRRGDELAMELPAKPATPCATPPGLAAGPAGRRARCWPRPIISPCSTMATMSCAWRRISPRCGGSIAASL